MNDSEDKTNGIHEQEYNIFENGIEQWAFDRLILFESNILDILPFSTHEFNVLFESQALKR